MTQTQQPEAATVVSDAQIKSVFLANGFTIKEGLTDLKPYVYQAARALLATGGQAQAVPNGWREQFATEVYADLEAADNQDVPLEEYPARILKVLDSTVGPRHPVVIKWRNDAIEQCIAIALKYCRDPESHKYLKQDLEAMLASAPAHPAEGVPAQAAQPSDALIEAVDAWFAENTGLGGCSDKDVSELAEIFATHPTQPAAQGMEAPWGDLKVAFDCNDADALWGALDAGILIFPKGWKLVETDGSAAREVAIFRVDHAPTTAEGSAVRAVIATLAAQTKQGEQANG